ncbi:hypothetical protein GR168_12195 [Gordonia sp. JH63]|uniref:hypothetical protein n=1 Tax=Gordonia sp. JH63 TaxID=2698900 RepID=UPI00131FB47A|nr:hypothetical protein [Gordonia sp. JH63]QHD86056.1 hypothetical protein GR168_12195 [Gordonia sp. JH63]
MTNEEIWQSLPEVKETGGLDPESYLYNLGKPPTAIAIAMIHARQFRIYRDCLVRSDADNDSIDSWIRTLGDLESVEKVVNHLHVWDILDVDGPAAEFVGQWITAGWSRQARSQFPELRIESRSEENTYGVEVTVWSSHQDARR